MPTNGGTAAAATGQAAAGPVAPGPAGGSTVAELGEDSLVAAVVDRLSAAGVLDGPAVVVGPGDDAAVLAGGVTVVSTDALVEGVDFRTDLSTGRDVGVKTAVQCLADVEAMGALPDALLVSLVVPGGTPVAWCLGLAEGLAEECARAGAAVVGGDVADGPVLVVAGTATGRLPRGADPVTRSGALPGDVVALGGDTGASAAGLAWLLAGREQPPGGDTLGRAVAGAVAAHRAPRIDHEAGLRAREAGARALIDVSDGLVRDAARVAGASGARIDLDTAALTPPAELLLLGRELGTDALGWVLTGGEDHAMLACFPAEARLPSGFRAVGRVVTPGGTTRVLLDGEPYAGTGGWTHYARDPAGGPGPDPRG